jgi:hypothetical protein
MDNPVASTETVGSGGDNLEGEAMVERIKWCVKRTSLGFDRWDDPHARGPGLYFVVKCNSAAAFAEPMGANRWPVEDCTDIFSSLDALSETAEKVASTCDGAVMINNDGTIEEEMVRIRQLSTAEREQNDSLPYAEWMGARHMSALETSTRTEILAAITLSEEDGRMTVFTDGTFTDYSRDALEKE